MPSLSNWLTVWIPLYRICEYFYMHFVCEVSQNVHVVLAHRTQSHSKISFMNRDQFSMKQQLTKTTDISSAGLFECHLSFTVCFFCIFLCLCVCVCACMKENVCGSKGYKACQHKWLAAQHYKQPSVIFSKPTFSLFYTRIVLGS